MLPPGSSAEQVSQKPLNSWMTAYPEGIFQKRVVECFSAPGIRVAFNDIAYAMTH